MRLAAFQMIAKAADVAANLSLIETAAREASLAGAVMLVAPELATTGYGAGEAIRDLAEPTDGAQVSALAAMAARHRIAIAAGFPERAGDRLYNTAVFVDASGRRSFYRKCQLYGDYEKALFAPGDAAPVVFAFAGLKAGLLVCYDLEFAELPRRLAQAGAELILVPTALPESVNSSFIAEKVVAVRAFENQVALVYADHAGSDGRFAFAGRSCIMMPDGGAAARADAAGAALVFADYEKAAYEEARRENPYLTDRRTDLD
jgi:predicted amidohydrolase